MEYDFSGWVTRANLECSDGRIIMQDAFKHNDGQTVPLVWNHQHNNPEEVLGHILLENRSSGVYGYGTFNETESGKTAKLLVQHGDVNGLSIYANQLKQNKANVLHGNIREVSLVLAGANPGAYIESVACHGEESEEEAYIYSGEKIKVNLNVKKLETDMHNDWLPEYRLGPIIRHADDQEKEVEKEKEPMADNNEKTVQDVIDSMSEEQQNVLYALVAQALDEAEGSMEDEGDDGDMKHNIFDTDEEMGGYLTHSDEAAILQMAKSSTCGSFKAALESYIGDNTYLAHGYEDIEALFPEYRDVYPGAPELIERDQGWVTVVMNGVHKSPISRIRTRQMDARGADLRAFGYKKGHAKENAGNIKLLKRTTDPQTIYRKDALHRDDIIDITEFDVVEYQYGVMRNNLNEEIAMAILVGDQREDGDEMKIGEEHIRPIWKDDELYTIHYDIDLDSTTNEIQGSNTGANFGQNYIYSESFVNASLYAREKYKGSGNLTFFCTPHLLNIMLLARDLNGRRIYASKAELAAALNVNDIQTVEQFANLTRTTTDNKVKKLLGIFVNLSDYQVGSTKGGEIARFSQFDIDFNQEKYLIETRLSGALTKIYSAIAIEEDVTNA